MVNEEWRQFRDTKYIVSSFGRVASLKKRYCRLLNPNRDKDGYVRVDICFGVDKPKHFGIHRLVAECFVANPINFPVINHINGDKMNNHSSNLEWTTVAENTRHAYRLGLTKGPVGSKNGWATMDESLAHQIKIALQHNKTKQVAYFFDMPYSRISDIKAGRSWDHVCV